MNTQSDAKPVAAAPLTTAAALPLVAWTGHLVGSAALAGELCTHPSVVWAMHALTAGTALICVACAVFGFVTLRKAHHSDAAVPVALRFGATLVIAIALANLLLIVWEGSYTEFMPTCR